MAKRALALSKVHGLIEPGPVLLLATSRDGSADIMPMSWHTMMDFEPPLVGCIVSDRNHSFENLRRTKECVLGIPTVEIADKVVACGNTSGSIIDKFRTFGLTPLKASRVDAPLIAECCANFECRVVDTKFVPKYCFFVLEVVKAWTNPAIITPRTIHHRGRGEFMVAGETIRLASRKK